MQLLGVYQNTGLKTPKNDLGVCTLIFTPILKTRFLIHGLRKKYRIREEQSKVMISFPRMEIQVHRCLMALFCLA